MVSLVSDWRRLCGLAPKDRYLLLRTAAALASASAAIRLLPFRKVVGSAGELPRDEEPDAATCAREIARTSWAVNALGRRLPWRIVCFQKGLALHRLLRRRGIRTRLHYGVTQDSGVGLKAHVWVTHDGVAVIGGAEAEGYTCLATFPASPVSETQAVAR
jgi:hypothetical protein